MMDTKHFVDFFACPQCKGPLHWNPSSQNLGCAECKIKFPSEKGVLVFLGNGHYSASFGFQWKKHSRTQLDKFNGLRISHERFYRQTGWTPEELAQKSVLEIGSGSGRFTEIALAAGARVVSLESSDAIFVNAQNNPSNNLCPVKASLFEQPFLEESFDYMVCFGVIQHTPDVQKAFRCLFSALKPGGKFCVDVYAAPYSYIHPRHWIRPFLNKKNSQQLYERVSRIVPKLLPLSNALHKVPLIGEGLARMIPIANWRKNIPLSDEKLALEWSILDTFDWYSPAFEKPQFLRSLKKWCQGLQLKDFQIRRHRGLYVVSGVK